MPVTLELHEERPPPGPRAGGSVVVPRDEQVEATGTPAANIARPGRTRRMAAIATGGGGVVLVGVGVVFGVLARGERDRVSQLCGGAIDRCDPSGYDEATLHHARAGRDALLGNLGIGLGAAAVITGAVLFLTAPRGERATRISTSIAPGNVGLVVAGSF